MKVVPPCFILCAAIFSAAAAPAQQTAPFAPVPPSIASAKTIFLSNAGSDAGLFPSPFTGDPERPYDQIYTALQASRRFSLVEDPSAADLVLELRLFAPYGPTNPNKAEGASDPQPMLRLVVYDRKTHYILWTLTQTVPAAVGQKNHDRKLDQALDEIAQNFLLLGTPQGAAPSPAGTAP